VYGNGRISLIVRSLVKDPSFNDSVKEYLMLGDTSKPGSGFTAGSIAKNYRRKQYQREVVLRNRR